MTSLTDVPLPDGLPAGYSYYLITPRQQSEVDRLHLQHEAWMLVHDGALKKAPTTSTITRALDIGCGSGVWTTLFAQANPHTIVEGIDLDPPRPNPDQPSNLTFINADAEQDWTFAKDRQYDFITARVLIASVKDWPGLFRRCLAHLSPGGWLEVCELTMGSLSDRYAFDDDSDPLMKWSQWFRAGAASRGVDGFANLTHKTTLEEAGFVNVQELRTKCFLSEELESTSKGKAIARLIKLDCVDLAEAVTKFMVEKKQYEKLGISERELVEVKASAEREVLERSKENQYYWIFTIHTAQKTTE